MIEVYNIMNIVEREFFYTQHQIKWTGKRLKTGKHTSSHSALLTYIIHFFGVKSENCNYLLKPIAIINIVLLQYIGSGDIPETMQKTVIKYQANLGFENSPHFFPVVMGTSFLVKGKIKAHLQEESSQGDNLNKMPLNNFYILSPS